MNSEITFMQIKLLIIDCRRFPKENDFHTYIRIQIIIYRNLYARYSVDYQLSIS